MGRGLVLAHWRGGSSWSGLRCQGQEEDREKTEQYRAEGSRPRQPASSLLAYQGRRWAPDDNRRPAATGPYSRKGRDQGPDIRHSGELQAHPARGSSPPARPLPLRGRGDEGGGGRQRGQQAYVVLLEGHDENDPLFLQVKEAGPSVLEGYLPPSAYKHHGHRVVAGQRLMQADLSYA